MGGLKIEGPLQMREDDEFYERIHKYMTVSFDPYYKYTYYKYMLFSEPNF